MANEDTFLRQFYSQLAERPLEPDDPLYIPLYEDRDPAVDLSDPVKDLATTIEWTPSESVQLFSGFRGTGKSTELRRLRRRLQGAGYKVALCHMQDYLNLTTPVDISDFLIAMAGALSDALEADDLLGEGAAREGYWARFAAFLARTRVDVTELNISVSPDRKGADLKASLKQDPTFRQVLQERMKGHISALVGDVRQFFEQCAKAIKARYGQPAELVLLMDSIEQIRGTSVNAAEVYASVDTLFSGHATNLRFPYLHVVYTAPPWLKIRSGGVASSYDGFQMLPCVKVCDRGGQVWEPGVRKLIEIVSQRGDWRLLLGSEDVLRGLILKSGGYLRDLFRLLQSCMRQTRGRPLPVAEAIVERAEHEIQNSYLPISEEDVLWLARVEETRESGLQNGAQLPDFSRFLDNHVILSYRNGEEWYRVHPLIADQVCRQARAQQPEPAANGKAEGP